MAIYNINNFVQTLQSKFSLTDSQTQNVQKELQYLPSYTPIGSNDVDMHALDHNIALALGVSLESNLHAAVIDFIHGTTLIGYGQEARPVDYIVSHQRLVKFYVENGFPQELVAKIDVKMQEFLNHHVSLDSLSTAKNMQDMTWLQQELSPILQQDRHSYGMEHYIAGIVQAALIGVKLERYVNPGVSVNTLVVKRKRNSLNFRVII